MPIFALARDPEPAKGRTRTPSGPGTVFVCARARARPRLPLSPASGSGWMLLCCSSSFRLLFLSTRGLAEIRIPPEPPCERFHEDIRAVTAFEPAWACPSAGGPREFVTDGEVTLRNPPLFHASKTIHKHANKHTNQNNVSTHTHTHVHARAHRPVSVAWSNPPLSRPPARSLIPVTHCLYSASTCSLSLSHAHSLPLSPSHSLDRILARTLLPSHSLVLSFLSLSLSLSCVCVRACARACARARARHTLILTCSLALSAHTQLGRVRTSGTRVTQVPPFPLVCMRACGVRAYMPVRVRSGVLACTHMTCVPEIVSKLQGSNYPRAAGRSRRTRWRGPDQEGCLTDRLSAH